MGKLDTKQGREEAAMAVSGYRSTTGSNTVGRLVSLGLWPFSVRLFLSLYLQNFPLSRVDV